MANEIHPFDEAIESQGWNQDTQLMLALEFIKGHCDDALWRMFIRRKVADENDQD